MPFRFLKNALPLLKMPFRKAVDHFLIPKKEVFQKWTLLEISRISMYFGVF